MIHNYLLISLRYLKKHLSYSLINVAGLALGLATCLLLVSWMRHELSYDTFHEKADRIYRASLEYSFGGHVARPSVSPNALLPALLTLPETESGVRVYNPSRQAPFIVRFRDDIFEESRFYFADSTFFDVFTFHLSEGNTHTALNKPNSVVVTQRMAQKYFGDGDAIGKVLLVNDEHEYFVTGIAENPPANSILQFDFIASFHSLQAGREEPTWWSANYQTFALIHEKADVDALNRKINEIASRAVAAELTGPNDYVQYNFLPLTDIYLRSDFDEEEIVSDIQYIYIFSGVTLLILVIACINYINLATARAAGRAKEVGIRKVTGALRKQLFLQFISESFVITTFSFALAFGLALLLLPFFNQLTGKQFNYASLLSGDTLRVIIPGLLITTLAAGTYPALALTAFNPAIVLKGNFQRSGHGIWLRKALVVVQFCISAILITSTLIVSKQLEFIQSTRPGFDRENTIILPLDKKSEGVFDGLRTELKRSGIALQVARGSESPASVKAGYGLSRTSDDTPGIITRGLLIDEEYIPALGMELIAGRNFTADDVERLSRDTIFTFVLNESALAALYIPLEDAVGTRVRLQGQEGEIIGVVKDFHFTSLHNPIGPLVMIPQERFRKMFVKLPARQVAENLETLRQIYGQRIQHRPFEFQFLDRQYAALYAADERMGSVAIVFAGLAIVIACLGLFGLVSFAAEQKRKEIGIRKVLGATMPGLVMLITREFSRPVVIAVVASMPIAWWLMSDVWLSGFAYKTEIGILPFVIASGTCILIALATTAYQAIKASLIDPAETLRTE